MPEFEELKDFISGSEVGFQVAQELKANISGKIKELQKMQGVEQIMCFIKILNDLMLNKTLHIPLSAGKNFSGHISDNDKRIIDAQSYIRKNFAQQNLLWMILQNKHALHHRHFADLLKTDRYYLYPIP